MKKMRQAKNRLWMRIRLKIVFHLSVQHLLCSLTEPTLGGNKKNYMITDYQYMMPDVSLDSIK